MKNKQTINSKAVLESIAEHIEKHFEYHPKAEEIADDIRHSIDGFMSEDEIGAMVVDLIKFIAEDNFTNVIPSDDVIQHLEQLLREPDIMLTEDQNHAITSAIRMVEGRIMVGPNHQLEDQYRITTCAGDRFIIVENLSNDDACLIHLHQYHDNDERFRDMKKAYYQKEWATFICELIEIGLLD